MTTYYLSGKMSGEPNYNFDLFNEVAASLRKQGHDVINPAENFDGDQGLRRERYMKLAIRQVLDADAIVMLPGWTESRGAQLEVQVAAETGKQFYVAETLGSDRSWNGREVSAESVLTEAQVVTGPTEQADPPETIEQTARRLVYGARENSYGPPTKDFARTGRVWASLLDLPEPISAELVAIMMAALKLSRLAQTPDHRDSRIDVIGYALCLDRVLEDRAKGAEELDAQFAELAKQQAERKASILERLRGDEEGEAA